jgi:hypothetical protein
LLRGLARDWSFSLLAIVILGTALDANAALFAFLSGYPWGAWPTACSSVPQETPPRWSRP